MQERACMCCQESGEREAVVELYCPKEKGQVKKVSKHIKKSKVNIKGLFLSLIFLKLTTRAPADCMCRPCTAVEDDVTASEIAAGYADPGSMIKSFIKF